MDLWQWVEERARHFRQEPLSPCATTLVEANELFDMIYIDSSHQFEDVFADAYFSK
jgi:hypothetical protein